MKLTFTETVETITASPVYKALKDPKTLALYGPLDVLEIKDTFGIRPYNSPNAGTYCLVFIDLEPEKFWAHDCLYVYISEEGELTWCHWEWPIHRNLNSTKVKSSENGIWYK
jgi:hypothetical protein